MLVAVLLLFAGCEGRGSSTAGARDSIGTDSAASQAPAPIGEAGGLDRCALLTDDEVQKAIGSHRPGSSDVGNEWGLQSCRWTATTAQKVDAFPDGWFDTIEVAVFDKDKESWARQQARGEPVQGSVEGALYDRSSGALWFNCARDRFCVVTASTASGTNREQVARQLAQLVQKRLQ